MNQPQRYDRLRRKGSTGLFERREAGEGYDSRRTSQSRNRRRTTSFTSSS